MKWETEIDERGRILIPIEIRDELKFRRDQRFTIETNGRRGLIIQPYLSPEEFNAEMNGCVAGSKIKPNKLKEIWGVEHPHH